jgi:Zn-finger nucleic acid-binding protein
MLCPICQQPLVIIEYQDVELDTCPDCAGLWFDAQELQQLFEITGVPEQFHDLEQQLERLPHAGPRRTCPRCRDKLVPVRATSPEGELILDECPREDGLWFDHGELESLLRGMLGEQSESLSRVREYLGHFAVSAEPTEDDES